MKTRFLLPLLCLWLLNPAQATDSSSAPVLTVERFLAWYLPTAFEKGADVVFDKRMEVVIAPKTLKRWRTRQKEPEGIGAVPFVGQDYEEAWATNFRVTLDRATKSTAMVTAQYLAPKWTQRLRIELAKFGDDWRIVDYKPLD